jgi:hypothetical protein
MTKQGFSMIPNQLIIDERLARKQRYYSYILGIYHPNSEH